MPHDLADIRTRLFASVLSDCLVRCAGVKVAPGDLIFGDADGVVVIPRAVEEKVLALALDKVKGEKRTLDDLRAGEKLGDVFAKYGIL